VSTALPVRPALHGILFMLGATVVLAAMHALVRVASSGMHPFEVAFFRNLFGFLVVLPLLVRRGRGALRTHQPHLQALRGVLGVVAMLAWFYGLSVVPLAEATALSFTATIFGTLGATLFLGERMRLRRAAAVAIGFAGTLAVLRPGFAEIDAGVLAVLLSAVCWGSSLVVVKRLSATDSTVSIVAWMSIMMTVLSLVPALLVWTPPTVPLLGWLLLIAALGTGGHLLMTRALALADASVVLPLDFARLVWTSIIGFLAFAEVPDAMTWVGGAVIIASTSYLAYRESRLRRGASGAGLAAR